MMLEFFGFEEASTGLVLAGLMIGVLFGGIAQRSRFCVRRAVIESGRDGVAPMAGAFAAAMLVAILGAQALAQGGWVALEETRFLSTGLGLGALIVGGAAFGAGMVLTRGCASRLMVLSGQGNLRALLVTLVFALTAYATMGGVLAPLRLALMEVGPEISGALTHPVLLTVLAVALVALIYATRRNAGILTAGAAIGGLVVLAWWATGFAFYDEFDPAPAEALTFTGPAANSALWLMTSTGTALTFGVTLVGGTILGSLLSALASREFHLESFEAPGQTLRYLAGAMLMGFGGVTAGGCTIGNGITGASTLAIAPFIALAAIAAGAKTMQLIVARSPASGVIIAAE